MDCINEIMPVHCSNRTGNRLPVFKKFCRKISVLKSNFTGMKKNHPAIEIQVIGYFINTLYECNGKNFRDLLFHVPGKWLNSDHEKHEKCEKKRNRYHQNDTDSIGGSIIVSVEWVQGFALNWW